ncbi:prolactin receptor, partial [Nowakowskiella sp. JEL0078]
QCESNPRLNKLGLADLLVKPMHRITRYPILLKRLLSCTKNPRDQESLNNLINRIEERVHDVNETLRKMEGAHRIAVIEDSLDFNNVTEKFKLANGTRELFIEKKFHYLKKNNTAPVEILALAFTDIVLLTKSRKSDYILIKQPIPLENCVFLDKPDSDGTKNVVQIIHLQNEIHNIQALSSFDKNNFLQQAETLRSSFCSNYLRLEQAIMKQKIDLSQSQCEENVACSPSPPAELGLLRRVTSRSDTSNLKSRDDSILTRASSWNQGRKLRNQGTPEEESELIRTPSKLSILESLSKVSSLGSDETTNVFSPNGTVRCESPVSDTATVSSTNKTISTAASPTSDENQEKSKENSKKKRNKKATS